MRQMPMRQMPRAFVSFEGASFGYVYWQPWQNHGHSPEAWSKSSFAELPGYGSTNPLVLVHGFGQSAQSWEPVVAHLDPGRPVWAFELMGHGSSDRPTHPQAYDLDFQGQALLAFLEFLVRESSEDRPLKVSVMGYSMGGRVVLSAMAQLERFASVASEVILESVGLGALSEEARAEAARKDAFHAQKLREEGLEVFFDYWENLPLFASQKALPAEVRQAIRNERLRNDAEALALTFDHAGQHCMPLREEVYQRLRAIQAQGVHVHYLAGEKDAKYVTLAREAAQAIGLDAAIVPNCGHNIHGELVG